MDNSGVRKMKVGAQIFLATVSLLAIMPGTVAYAQNVGGNIGGVVDVSAGTGGVNANVNLPDLSVPIPGLGCLSIGSQGVDFGSCGDGLGGLVNGNGGISNIGDLLGFGGGGGGGSGVSQGSGTPGTIDGADEGYARVPALDQVSTPEAADYHMQNYSGDSNTFDMFERSPLVKDNFDHNGMGDDSSGVQIGAGGNNAADKLRIPELAFDPSHEKRSLRILNLGVDNEVKKASWGIFQPLRKMVTSFSNDKTSRDDFLNLFSTLRGVAFLTLSYLDKTVAAGLASVQQQADQNNTQLILKQIAWSTTQSANPNLSRIFDDTREKVTECMANGGREVGRTKLDCAEACGAAPTGTDGLFGYCVCCSEATKQLNLSTEDNTTGVFSLIERVFYGTRKPKEGSEKKKMYENLVKAFSAMYGDIIVDSRPGQNPTYKFAYPRLSPVQMIDVFRNGCESEHAITCPAGSPERGVCPSIVELMKKWPVTEDNRDDMRKLWIEASLGKMLRARDIENFFRVGGLQPGELPADWEPSGKLRMFLDAFCDASAVTALERRHIRSSVMFDEAIMHNQMADPMDVQRIRDLRDRMSSYLSLARGDADANLRVEAALVGVGVESDNIQEATIAGALSAGRNQALSAAQRTDTTSFSQGGFSAGQGGADAGDPANPDLPF